MRPEERDEALLWDLRRGCSYARDVAGEVGGFSALEGSQTHQLALAMAIGLIGEAAARLSGAFRTAHPEIPWADIVGLRNRIVHEYSGLDFTILWDVASNEVPPLLAWTDAILREDPDQRSRAEGRR